MGAGRHRWEFMLKPGETPEAVAEDAFIADLLAPWNVEGAVTLERKAVYRFHALVARRWRRGPVLLAGDAAHQMPPFAGQGLCSGVRDAANLAWKLAAVLRGEASEALLDTYQREREPHVRAIIDLAMTMGRTVCITDPDAAAARDRAMLDARAAGAVAGGAMAFPPIEAGAILAGSPAAGTLFPQPWAGSGGSAARLDDVLGPGPWLIRRDAGDALAPVPTFTLADPRLPPFAGDLSAWLARHDAPAVLVRPDRVVFGTGAAQVLVEAYQAAIGHPGDQHPPALPGQRRSCTAVK
jgi:3-(3-hydroxy-phenyl)propionate hydroxylase